ncbi:hypothetical protein BDK51DRAFT_7409, partial [Blyttiomyces helicus]
PPPFVTDTLLPCAIMWQQQGRKSMPLALQRATARKPRESKRRGKRWAPWDDQLISDSYIVAQFRLCREDFRWLVDELKDELQLDPTNRG